MADRKLEVQARGLDVMAFSRQGGELQGSWPLTSMPRLSASLAERSAGTQASWQVQGEQRPVTGAEPEVWLHLQGQVDVVLQCQRCLQHLGLGLQAERSFRFVRTEAEALRLDEESEDDVLVLQPRLDLMELLEDEFILSLPIVPRHELCPSPLAAAGTAAEALEDEAHPFAALAALKLRKPSDAGH